MKKKVLFGVAALGLIGLAGAGIGLKNMPVSETVADSKTNLNGATIYLDASWWKYAGARMAVQAYGAGVGEKWYDMEEVAGLSGPKYGIYTVTLDAVDYTRLIFCRMNGSTAENNWDNRWNQTVDITNYDGSNSLFVVNGGSENAFTGVWKSFSTKEVYVLDLYGNSLNDYAQVHAWDSTDGVYETKWPGITMNVIDGGTNLYSSKVLNAANYIQFNNKHGSEYNDGYQTGDIAYASGCYILTAFNETPISVSLEVGKFIDKYMKFETVTNLEDKGTGKCVSLNWYADAKAAFENASFAAYRAELSAIDYVANRLSNWALANGDTFEDKGSGYAFYDAKVVSSPVLVNESSNGVFVVSVISVVAAVAVGGLFLLRKRKAE